MSDDTPDTEKKPRAGGFLPGYDPRRRTSGRKTRDEYGKAVIDEARSMGMEMLMIQAEIARDPTNKPADRSKAAERVLTRAYGAPKATIEVQGSIEQHHVHTAVDVSALSTELKRELLAAMMKQDDAIDATLVDDEPTPALRHDPEA